MSGTPNDISVPGPAVTVHSLPSSNPAGTSDTVALPVQGVTGGVPLHVSVGTLPLSAGAAQDGTDATDVLPPAGAAGIRGWLSGIYSKLASSVSVTGTFWQATQPVSAASLPLPAGAAQDGTDCTGISPPTGGVGIRGWLSGIFIKLNGTAAGTSAPSGPPVQGMTGGVPMPVSGTFWQATQPVSAATLPLPSGAAQDGTDATGVTLPAGAVGIRGWLSGIYSKLSGSLAVTGTFWQATQPISAASLPLPAGAATAAGVAAINTTLGTPMQATGGIVGIAAGTNAIGSIIGRTTMVTATPAVTSNGAYAAGNEIGGLMTFAIGGAGSGTLMSMRVTSRSVLSTALKAYIFSANPSNTTWADKTAPAIDAADIAKLLAVIPLNAPDSGLGTHTLWQLSGIAAQFIAANLYVVLVTVSAATLTSGTASDINVQLGVSDD